MTTRNAADAIIDGPTQSTAYTMKQIGANVIANDAITTPNIADNAVTADNIANDAITTPKIADNAVTTGKIQDGQVNTNDLADISVTNQKLAVDSVTIDKIGDGNVGTNDIADDAITTPKIADDAVTVSKLMEDMVHVVWTDNNFGSDQILYKRDGGGFDPSTGSPLPGAFSSIVVVGNNVHVVSTQGSTVFYARSTNGGGSFTIGFTFSGNAPINPSVAVSGNNVYILWEDVSGNKEIFYIRSTNGGANFGPPINLSNSAGLSSLPSIAASSNNVYVVWRDDTSGNNEILYRRSTDGGANFEPTVNLSNNAGGSGLPSVAVSGDNVYIVWEDNTLGNNEILYRRSTNGGANFEPTVNLSNNPTSSLFASIAVSGNSVYVVWDDIFPSTGVEILYKRSLDSGANFEPAINLNNSPSNSVTGASVAASDDNVYAVWNEIFGGTSEIVYKRSTDGGANFDITATSLSPSFGNSRDAHLVVS